MDYPTRRQNRLARLLKAENLDALLISNPVNVSYLTYFSGDSSYLILGRKQTLLVSDGRYAVQIAEECPGLEAHIRQPDQRLQDVVAKILSKMSLRSVGFESSHMGVAEWEKLKGLTPAIDWKGSADRVEKLRVIKDESEVARIREAIHIAERAYAMFRAMLRPADSEKDLCDALEMYIRRAGGRCAGFPSIVAVGARSALPHAPPTERTLGEADLVLIDWGAAGRFYKSDLTRVHATRRISPKLEKVYTVVLRAQERALHKIRPGVKACDVDAEARRVIAEAGYGQFFVHGLGHGLGLQVHEAPALRANSEDVLQAGMVFTIEPGIYLPGWGGVRIEDDVLVTADGCEVLSSVAKDLQVLMADL